MQKQGKNHTETKLTNKLKQMIKYAETTQQKGNTKISILTIVILDTEKPRHDSKMGLQLTPNPHQYLVLVLPIAVGLRISVSFLDLVFGPILGSRFEMKPPLKTGFYGNQNVIQKRR